MKSKILVVDDEENICFFFKMILETRGYDVITALDYQSALKAVSATEPDLIISDIVLGGYTGIDLLHDVKKRKLNSPVIMMTGAPSLETSIDAVRLGAFDYLTKPVETETLLRITALGLQHKKCLDKKQQLELENLKERRNMEAIFRSLKDGVITVDNELTVIEANEAVKTICGFSCHQMTGKNLKTIEKQCSRACITFLKETLETGKPVAALRVECRHSERPGQIVLLTTSLLRHDDMASPGAVLVIRDMTKLTRLERQLENRQHFHRIIGKSREIRQVYTLLENLSDTDSTVLVTGDTGTGKELVAHAIHHHSMRRNSPFVTVNCSALAENLLESELFGHVKGAFTGAIKTRKGRFEMADKGTIFLDEIGDISPLIQVKLLRVLQEGELERVGDSSPVKIDVRVIAATHCNLREKIKEGKFREDLYYRIKVVDIPMPSLSERREDIPLLADHFLRLFNLRFTKEVHGISNEVMNAFMSYSWPGNIRELENAIEHGFVLCREKTILFEHLPFEIKEGLKMQKPCRSEKLFVDRDDILDALNRTDWNKSKAARILGIGRRTIYRKIEEYKLFNG